MFGIGGGQTYSSNQGAFDDYARRMGEAAHRYDPYINRGNEAGQLSLDEYKNNINNPNAVQDKIASGFEMSPYQKYILDQTTRRMNYNGANTGMQGSGAFQRALMDEMQKNVGQFQDNYINRGLGVYGQALNGLDRTAGMGMQGMNAQDALLQEEAGGYLKGQMSNNEAADRNNAASSNMFGSLIGMAAPIAGQMLGGPVGGAIGGFIGNKITGGQGGGVPNFGMQGNGGFLPNFRSAAAPTPNAQTAYPGQFNSGTWSY